jgi:hypothetical protein
MSSLAPARGAKTMKTLVDLLNDDSGYVRIYAELAGFGYERSTYSSRTICDLFDRMSGYACAASAREAAQLQLLALSAPKRRARRRS